MRHAIVIASLLLLPVPAIAQTAATPAPSLSETVPLPREVTKGVSGGRVILIAAGAVTGVIVANAITGGMITPVLLLGAENGLGGVAAVEAAETGWAIAQVGVTAAGAIVGGYVGNWIYGE